MSRKKVMISGCFDPIHSGHVKFFEVAAQFGDLYVSIGSDVTIKKLKGRDVYWTEEERMYVVKNLRMVKSAFIARGTGGLDFVSEMNKLKPDCFVVNKDGDFKDKRELCEKMGIEYKVLERIPHPGFLPRSSTEIRERSGMPYRIDLAGGWIDQPYVSKYLPEDVKGEMLVVSIEPTREFNLRSGMATSTRNKAMKLWGNWLPSNNVYTERAIENARALFGYENPPGTKEVAGSQDAIGIVMCGLNKLDYSNEAYWPREIVSCLDNGVLNWLEKSLSLYPLNPRKDSFKVLSKTNINEDSVKKLVEASGECYDAILRKDMGGFGHFMTKSFEAQVEMFPLMVNDEIMSKIEVFRNIARGWKLSGAGGGGYIVLVGADNVDGCVKVKIRRD